MIIKVTLILLFLGTIALLSGGCSHDCDDSHDTQMKELPSEVAAVIRPHTKSQERGHATAFDRFDFTPSELATLDAFTLKYTTRPFSSVTVSGCGECITGGGSQGVYVSFPLFHVTFCLSCAS